MHIPGDDSDACVVRVHLPNPRGDPPATLLPCLCHAPMPACACTRYTFTERPHFLLRYPTTVATLSRRARDIIEAGFVRSVDEVGLAG